MCHYSIQRPMGRPRKRRRDEPSNAEITKELSARTDSAVGLNIDIMSAGTGEGQHLPQDTPFGVSAFEELDSSLANVNLLPDLDGFQAEGVNPFTGLHTSGSQIEDIQWTQSPLPVPTDGQLNQNPAPALPNGNGQSAPFLTSPTTSSDYGCQCITSMYATLSSFQSLPPSSFPYSMGKLTAATTVARDALRCQHCPNSYATALQNMMSLCTLLPLIAHEYGKLLQHIDERSAKGGSISFRMGENSFDQLHLHSGTIDCPMAFDMDFSAAEWRAMARKVIRRKVLGGSDLDLSLLGLVEELEIRQRGWHANPPLAEFRHGLSCMEYHCPSDEKHTCLQMISRARAAIQALRLEDDST